MKDARRTVLLVVDGRARAIRLAPLYWALACHPWLEPALIHLASDDEDTTRQALAAFALAPDYQLTGNDADGWAAARAFDHLLEMIRPALVLVPGTSPAAMMATLAAVAREVPVACLDDADAGVPLGRGEPAPPGGAGRTAGRLATRVFTASAEARAALIAGGLAADRVIAAGSTISDALALVSRRRGRAAPAPVTAGAGPLLLIALGSATAAPIEEDIAGAVSGLLAQRPDLRVIWPMTRDPLTARPGERRLRAHANVLLSPPLSYDRFIATLRAADLVLTNSATIVEEARALGRPWVVPGEPAPEAVGGSRTDTLGSLPSAAIAARIAQLLSHAPAGPPRARAPSLNLAVPRILAGIEALLRAEATSAAA